MWHLFSVTAFWVVFFLFPASCVSNTTLRFVHIVGRHGNRTPLSTIPNDPNNDLWDDVPLGFLTKAGMNAMYENGKFLRHSYSTFLSEFVDSSETYARSTDKDRTLKSAQLLLAGLYPPKGRAKWNSGLGQVWEPVSVHTRPQSMDPFVDNYPMDYCPRFRQLMDMFVKTPEGERMYARVLKILDVVASQGVTWSDYYGFLYFADTIEIEVVENRTVAPWLQPYETEILELNHYFTFTFVNVPEMRQLAGGYLIYEIMNRMKNIVPNTSDVDATKLYYYSAHDCTILFVMASFGIIDEVLPPFASMLFLELHQDTEGDGEFYVQVLYRNDPNGDPIQISFPWCPNEDMCNWNSVWNNSVKMFVPDLVRACQPYSESEYWTVLEKLLQMYP